MKPDKSTSMRMLFKKCPRLIYFRYVAGIEKKQTYGALFIGSCFHSGLQELRRKGELSDAYEMVNDLFEKSETSDDDSKVDLIKVNAYLLGYYKAFMDDFKRNIETEKKLVHGDDICFIDAVIHNDDGSIDIIEDKTTAAFVDNMEMALVNNEQLLNYIDLCYYNEIKINKIKYRETLKSLHSLKRDESIELFRYRMDSLYVSEKRFREFEFNYHVNDLSRFLKDKDYANREINLVIDNHLADPFDAWPCNGFSCIGKFGPCDYLPICSRTTVWVNEHFKANDKQPLDRGYFRTCHDLNDCGKIDNPFNEEISE